jgi:hypothetical protein
MCLRGLCVCVCVGGGGAGVYLMSWLTKAHEGTKEETRVQAGCCPLGKPIRQLPLLGLHLQQCIQPCRHVICHTRAAHAARAHSTAGRVQERPEGLAAACVLLHCYRHEAHTVTRGTHSHQDNSL